jgi:zinc transport system permease protein
MVTVMTSFYDFIRIFCEHWARAGVLPESFQYAFVVNSILCALLIGPLLGGVGTMVVTKHLAFFSQAVGQAALTGVAIGIVLGEPYTSPYASLFGFCILFGLVMNFTRNRTRMSSDTVIGVFLSISLAFGACVLLYVTSKVNMHVLDNILFGSILTINDTDMNVLLIITVICAAVGLPLYNKMLMASFNSSLAHVRGIRVKFLEYLFILMITVITVASLKIVGAVLVEALFIIPAAAARNISRSMKGFFFYSVTFSTLSCLVGVILPMELELPVPSGGAIILAASVFFIVTALIRMAGGRFKEAAI